MSISGGPSKALERGRSIGCTAIQIFVKNNMQWFAKPFSEADLTAYHRYPDRPRMVFGHTSYLINPGARNPEFLEKSIRALTEELARADQLELIDSSADQLRRRMLHGNIYPEHKVPAALNGFFRAENLVALRELSLRFVADETEEELMEFLRSRGAAGELWETTERIMVAVTGAPGNAAVIRRAARIAARIKADLIAVHVISGDDASRASTAELEELVKAVGGRWQTLEGDDVAKTIFTAAIDQQITQIVVGT